jgi:arylsulfatase
MNYPKTSRLLAFIVALAFASTAIAQDKPNILIIWGDDIGWFNVSAYNHGMMGYKHPTSTKSPATA